jgi:hypothetical protein
VQRCMWNTDRAKRAVYALGIGFAVTLASVSCLRATFGVRNARADNVVFDVQRENLLFVPASTALTLPHSPIRSFEGTAASGALVAQLTPTALMSIDGDGQVFTADPDVLRSLNDAQVRATAVPTGASALFGYAFPVKQLTSVTFDGGVTVGYRLPVAAQAGDNPTSISILFVIVDDTGAKPH